MKYFTVEFEKQLDSAVDRETAEKMISEQTNKYWLEFDSCAHRLPKSFSAYYKSMGFHDYNIEKLELIKRRTKNKTFLDIIMQLTDEGKTYEIHYFNVIRYETIIDEDSYCEIGDYLDDEILPVNDEYLSHEFHFYSSANHVTIHFKKLSFKKL